MKMVDEEKHFVLVHGACHGAWCWYKVKPQLESAGHRVTVLDLAASGINMKSVDEARTLDDYSKPLLEMMASLSPDERVILAGHSLGGLSLALAMDKFPNKVSLAIFIAAFMPDTIHQKLYFLDKLLEMIPKDSWIDTQFLSYGSSNEPLTCFGPKFLSSRLYQLSPVEDLELATMLMRPVSLFLKDLTNAEKFSNEGYGSVTRVYIGCDEDKIITKEVQLSMIENSGVKEVMEIKGADHMPMFSKPQQLRECLLELSCPHHVHQHPLDQQSRVKIIGLSLFPCMSVRGIEENDGESRVLIDLKKMGNYRSVCAILGFFLSIYVCSHVLIMYINTLWINKHELKVLFMRKTEEAYRRYLLIIKACRGRVVNFWKFMCESCSGQHLDPLIVPFSLFEAITVWIVPGHCGN